MDALALSGLVLHNLSQIKDKKTIVDLAEVLKGSSVEIHREVYLDALKFYELNGKFPDAQFLELDFLALLGNGVGKFSLDVPLHLMRLLVKEKAQLSAQEHLSKGDFKKVKEVLNLATPKEESKEFTSVNAIEAYDKMILGPSGMLLGITEVDQVAKGMSYGTMTVLAAPPRCYKCLAEGTRVGTSLGYNKIESLYSGPVDLEGFAPFKTQVRGGVESSHFYKGGEQRTIRIVSKAFSLEGTPIHKVKALVEGGVKWVSLEELVVGDYVCLERFSEFLFDNKSPRPTYLEGVGEEDYGWLLGFLLGDGGVSKRRVYYCLNEEMKEKVKKLFPVEWKEYRDKRSDDLWTLNLNSSVMAQEMLQLGLGGTSYTKEVPEWVYSTNRKFIVGFLSGLMDADGCFNRRMVLNLMSRELIYGVQQLFNLLAMYPIVTKYKVKYLGVYRDYYRLEMLNGGNEKLGIFKLRTEKAGKAEVLVKGSVGDRVPFVQGYRDEIWRLYHKYLCPLNNRRRKELRKVLSFVDHSRDLLRTVFYRKTWDEFKLLLPKEVWENSCIEKDLREYNFSQVEEKFVGEKRLVFDLSIPSTKMFMANGLINHNTTSAISVAYNATVKAGFNGIYISLESLSRDVWFNFLSRHSAEMGRRISAEKIKKGMLTEEELRTLREVEEDWRVKKKGKFSLLTTADIESFEPDYLDSIWRKKQEEFGELDYVILDYIQRCAGYKGKREETEFLNSLVQYFTNLSTSFSERGLIVVILSQINRQGEMRLNRNRRADLTSFAGLNSLERDAHLAIVAFADDAMRNSNTALFQIVKNRSGPSMGDMVSVFVDPEVYSVGAADTQALFNPNSMDELLTGAGEIEGADGFFA